MYPSRMADNQTKRENAAVVYFICLQDAICDISEYGMIIIVEELNCLQGKVYFRKEVDFRHH